MDEERAKAMEAAAQQQYNQVAQEMRTEVDLSVHQESRSAIGSRMGLDIGPPNEAVMLATGKLAQARDALGLKLDPMIYASRKCSHCYGRGTVILVKHVPIAVALKLIKDNPANEALLHQREPGKYHTRQAEKCGCVQRRYTQRYTEFAEALVKAGLAKRNSTQKRYDLV
jgi:hypothetical protein